MKNLLFFSPVNMELFYGLQIENLEELHIRLNATRLPYLIWGEIIANRDIIVVMGNRQDIAIIEDGDKSCVTASSILNITSDEKSDALLSCQNLFSKRVHRSLNRLIVQFNNVADNCFLEIR